MELRSIVECKKIVAHTYYNNMCVGMREKNFLEGKVNTF